MTITIAELEAEGWFLSEEGINLVTLENPEIRNINDFIAAAKDTDLRQLSSKGFNKTNEKVSVIPSPCVLQVLEVRNIAMPSVNQVEKPKLLSIIFTNGSKKKYKGVEALGKVDCIKLQTPPGTKFLVTKPIEVKDQILLLGPNMLKELGGHVQELVQAWRAGKQFLKRFGGKSSNTKEGEVDQGPPAFIPFKVKPTLEKKPKSTTTEVINDNTSPLKSKKKENKQADRSKTSVSEKKKPIKDSTEKKNDEVGEQTVASEDNSASLEKPKRKKKSERKPKKNSDVEVSTVHNNDDQSKATAVDKIENDVKKDNTKRSERKKDSSSKNERKIVENVEQVQKDANLKVSSEEGTRKNRTKKSERSSTKKTQDRKDSIDKVQLDKKPAAENSESSTTVLEKSGEQLDAEKPKSKSTSRKRDENKKTKDTNSTEENGKKSLKKSERKGKSKGISILEGSVDDSNSGRTTPNDKSKIKEQQSNDNNSEANLRTITEKNEGEEGNSRKVRKERKKKPQSLNGNSTAVANGVEEQVEQSTKTNPKKKKEKPQKNKTDSKVDKNRISKKNSTSKQEGEDGQNENRKSNSEAIVPETSSTPTVATPVMQQTPSPPSVLPTSQPQQQRQPQAQQQQAVYYNNVAYDDYYYQQPYTAPGVDYGMMVPVMNHNTAMYGYQQPPQYVQPVYYMHDQQPYYNQYMQTHQPQTQYYDHHPQQSYQNYRGRGGGRGGRESNNYRGGHDQQ
ncbi:unnamed protein product [Mucor hiemalis]